MSYSLAIQDWASAGLLRHCFVAVPSSQFRQTHRAYLDHGKDGYEMLTPSQLFLLRLSNKEPCKEKAF